MATDLLRDVRLFLPCYAYLLLLSVRLDSFPLALALPFSLIVRPFSLTSRQTLWPSPLLLCGFRLHTVRLSLLSDLTLLLSLLLLVGLYYLLSCFTFFLFLQTACCSSLRLSPRLSLGNAPQGLRVREDLRDFS